MTRLIEAEKLKKHYAWWEDDERRTLFDQIVDAQPTIDAEPVRHGKWIPHEDEDGEHYGDKCSECGEWYVMPYGKTNFCPHCGARMDMKGTEG